MTESKKQKSTRKNIPKFDKENNHKIRNECQSEELVAFGRVGYIEKCFQNRKKEIEKKRFLKNSEPKKREN